MEDKHKATKVTLYLSQGLHRQLKIRSAVDGEPMSALAARALDFYLSHSAIVEEHSGHGHAHRVYGCPECSESLVMRDGKLIAIQEAVDASRSNELHVDMQGVMAEESSPEEGQLVTC